MKISGICLLLMLTGFVVSAQIKTDTVAELAGWKDLGAAEFKKLLADTLVVLVDVRTPAEYQAGHIERARNIDVRGVDFDERILLLDRKRPVAVYCKSGVRSRMAARKLVKRGFRVYNLDKGYLSYKK